MSPEELVTLGRVADTLIEQVSKAVGVLYGPTRIKNQAKAEAEALLVKTDAAIESLARMARARDRFVANLVQRDENLEVILGRAAKLVGDSNAVGGSMDPDWVRRFVAESEDVSDTDMQQFWARLLAGEFQRPGSYSRRLLTFLKDLDPRGAKMIEAVAPEILRVEDFDGSVFDFFLLRISESWSLGVDGGGNEVWESGVEESGLFRELGLVEPDSYLFGITAQGRLEPDKIVISDNSARRIFTSSGCVVPKRKQPEFVRTVGPSVTQAGVPRINKSVKSVGFHGLKLTQLGESMFSLAAREPNPDRLAKVRGKLLEGGLELEA
jgi:hypothetical protein